MRGILHWLLAWGFSTCSAARCNSHPDQLSRVADPALLGLLPVPAAWFCFQPTQWSSPVPVPQRAPGPSKVRTSGSSASCAWRGSVAPL